MMGRNKEIIDARTRHWATVAEEYAKSKFAGDNPEHVSLAMNLFNESSYDYYQIVAALGEREAIYEQIDEDIEDLSKCIAIIQKLAAMLGLNNWSVKDLEDAIKFLFSGNSFVRNVFETEIKSTIPADDMFADRVDFIQNIGQYVEELPISSVEVGETNE
jgi:hypothetical protein